jgi:methionyl-tRNA synthetase
MFRLNRFRDDIRHWLLDKPDIIQPRQQLNQVLSWLDQSSELPDISVSRPRTRQSWGIPVPDDQTQTVYVWLDALTNYLTVCGYPGPNDCSPNTAVYHVIGKDILKFHAIYV